MNPVINQVINNGVHTTVDRVFFTNIREETRKADKCGLIRVENRLYKLSEQYSNQSVFIQITDTEIIFHDADNKVIRIDKTTVCV